MVITVETLLDHFTQGYVITAWCPRCYCHRDVNLVKLIRLGKAHKPISQLRIRHKCGGTMQLQSTPPPQVRSRKLSSAQVLPFDKPKT
jgi:hypothetical protein